MLCYSRSGLGNLTGRVILKEVTEQEQGDFLLSLSTTDGFTWPSVHFGTDRMITLLRGGRVVSYLKDTHFRTRDEIVLLTCPLASKIALLPIFFFNHLTNYIKVFNLPTICPISLHIQINWNYEPWWQIMGIQISQLKPFLAIKVMNIGEVVVLDLCLNVIISSI